MSEPSRQSESLSPIRPRDLLRHAHRVVAHHPVLAFAGDAPATEEIARVLAGFPAPSEADLRRGVSAAYYALFHAVTLRASAFLAPGRGLPQQYRNARRFEHRSVRLAALWVTESGTAPRSLASRIADARNGEAVRRVADAIRHLSYERRDADYNHFAQFTDSGALRAIDRADDAVGIVESPAFAQSEAGQAFLRVVADQVRSGA